MYQIVTYPTGQLQMLTQAEVSGPFSSREKAEEALIAVIETGRYGLVEEIK